MNLKYLGTAAAEAVPALFCDCEVCRRSLEKGGRNLRSRSQALLDGKILIDFPADTYWHSLTYGIDLTKIATLLITHVHSDHLYPNDLEMRNRGYSHLQEGKPQLTVYGSEDLTQYLSERSRPEQAPCSFAIHTVEPWKPFTVEDNYEITALPAVHGTPHPYNYLIRQGEATLLYAHDTSYFREEVFEYLKSTGVCLTLASLDCTMGNNPRKIPRRPTHMSMEDCMDVRDRLLQEGIADKSTVFVLNHFSHNGASVMYDDFAPLAAEYGFIVSYDGLEVEF